MHRWLRLLMVWLIAVSLPVQGIAGVAMAHCGSKHLRMAAVAQAAAHQHAHHDAGVAHHHGSDAADGSDVVDHAAASQAKVTPDSLPDPTQSKCSSCASCCAGSALPSAMPRLPQPAAAPAVFTEALVAVDAVAADGPDRPPRTRLV